MADADSTGMDKDEMKALLRRASPDNPMNFAFGADKKRPAFALLIMHKSKGPKACEQLLLKEFPDAFNVRYGTVTVEPDDPKRAKFKVNKAVSGFAKKLAKTLKPSGYSKAEVLLEDGTAVDAAAEEEDVATPTLGEAGGPTAEQGGTPVAPSGGPATQGTTPTQDAETLKKALAELAGQIKTAAGSDGAVLARLSKMATDANVNLKTNNLTYAATFIAQLRAAIGALALAKGGSPATGTSGTEEPATSKTDDVTKVLTTLVGKIKTVAGPDTSLLDKLSGLAREAKAALDGGDLKAAVAQIGLLKDAMDTAKPSTGGADPSGQGGARPKGAAVKLAQAMILWNEARSHVAGQIKELQNDIIEKSKDEPDAADIRDIVGNLEEILENLDDSLTGKLNALRGTTDVAQKEALSEEARATVRKMLTYAGTDPLMKNIDKNNGFIPLTIQSRVLSSLNEVLATI